MRTTIILAAAAIAATITQASAGIQPTHQPMALGLPVTAGHHGGCVDNPMHHVLNFIGSHGVVFSQAEGDGVLVLTLGRVVWTIVESDTDGDGDSQWCLDKNRSEDSQ